MDLLSIGSALFMLFFFGFCIFIHELGHFLAAKWRGLHIVAFSIGFRKIWGIKYKGVEYRIGCLPFGGYVDLPQIDSSETKKVVDGVELPPVKPVDRLITAAAGPLFNILFGFLFGILVWVYGIPQSSPELKTVVVEAVEEGSPEYLAGLRAGDEIIRLNGESLNCTWDMVVRRILFTVGKVELTVNRGGKLMQVSYEPKENPKHFSKEKIGYPFFTPRIPLVITPEAGSPAAKAGIKAGDILVAVGGHRISDMKGMAEIAHLFDNDELELTVNRGGNELVIKGLRPDKRQEPGRYKIGITFNPEAVPVTVSEVIEASPARRAGIEKGDQILAIGGHGLSHPRELPGLISAGKGQKELFKLKRGERVLELEVVPEPYVVYSSGLSMTIIGHPTPWDQFVNVISMSYQSLRSIGYRVASKVGLTEKSSTLKPRNFSGPVGIGTMMFKTIYYGSFIQGIYLVVIITFSLGLLNLMPLPILDGGHILFSLIETVVGRPLPHKYLQPVNIAFIIFLVSFMLYVTVFDVNRLIPEESRNGTQNGQSDAPKNP